jgi:hypothetical protein
MTEEKKVPSKNRRVKHICRLMARLDYYNEVTLEELSERWGVGVATLKYDAAEASRINRMLFEADRELKDALMGALRAVASKCLKVKGRNGEPSHKHAQVAINALKAIADIHGLQSRKEEDQHAPLPVVDEDRLKRMAEAWLAKPKIEPEADA